MTGLNQAFAPPSPEELATAAVASNDVAQGSAVDDDLVSPAPPDAPVPHFRHPDLGQPTATWRYADASGATLGFVARFDPPGARKQVIPHTYWRDRHGIACWRWRSWPAPRPLYGLDRLAAGPEALVLVAEGEKACDAASLIFPEAVSVTSPGGSEAARKADWTPLAGRRVLIWPDADQPGLAYARDVRAILAELGTDEIDIVDAMALALDTPGRSRREQAAAGWDAADALEDGWVLAELREAVLARAARASDEPRFVSFGPFTMDASGLTAEVRKGRGENASLVEEWISGPFEVIGRARDPAGHGWAKWLRWRDPDGRRHEHAVSDAALHGDVGALCSELATRGLAVSRGHRAQLAEYLNRVEVRQRVTTVARTGWHTIAGSRVFVLPDETIGSPPAETVVLTGATSAPYGVRGTLGDWQQGVGRLAAGHTRLVLAVSTALAGTLLGITGAEGGGVNLHGPSSKGKTTALQAGASVWGRGATDPGFVRSWRGTANSQESGAALVSDTLLCLDEIGVAEAKDAAAAVYQLATGIGKGRSRRDGTLREPMTWRVLTLSTGEIAMAAKVSEDRTRRAFAGQAVRLLDIPADAGRGHGVFDSPGEEGDAGRLADAIKQAAITSYGTAGPAFVRRLIGEDAAEVGALVSEMVAAFQSAQLRPDADGQVRRAAARLGLIGAAGELAREWGIVPWAEGEAMEAAARALADWIGTRGGTEPAEVREALLQVRRFFEAHGEARFEPVEGGADARPVTNRVGWRRGFGAERTWLVLPELWKAEVCAGLDAIATAHALADRGVLRPDGTGRKLQRTERTPYGHKRVYVMTASIFEEDA